MFVFYHISYHLDFNLKLSVWLVLCYSFFFYWFYVFLNNSTIRYSRIGKRVFWTNFCILIVVRNLLNLTFIYLYDNFNIIINDI
jgi:hypothetical protein